jgi:hypothetical protein
MKKTIEIDLSVNGDDCSQTCKYLDDDEGRPKCKLFNVLLVVDSIFNDIFRCDPCIEAVKE